MNMKDMITDGTVVKFRDGRLAVLLRDINPKEDPNTYKFYGLKELMSTINNGGIVRLDAYDDNLDNKETGGILSKYDIMAIASEDHFNLKDTIRIMFGFVSEDDISWNWKREDVIEEIWCKVKIVKEEN